MQQLRRDILFPPLRQVDQQHTGIEIGRGVQTGRVIPFGTGKKGVLYRRNGITVHIEVEQIV